MRDDAQLNIHFVHLIEQFPPIYNYNLTTYGKRCIVDTIWENVRQQMTEKCKEEVTVEECKSRWKGIRSSYCRARNKAIASGGESKPYYLNSALKFIEPFTKKPAIALEDQTICEDFLYPEEDSTEVPLEIDADLQSIKVESMDDDHPLCDYEDAHGNLPNLENDSEVNANSTPVIENTQSGTIEVSVSPMHEKNTANSNDVDAGTTEIVRSHHQITNHKHLKRRCEQTATANDYNNYIRSENQSERKKDMSSAHMDFFRSLIPDMQDFTPRQIRKFKINVLQIIDDIDSENNTRRLFTNVK